MSEMNKENFDKSFEQLWQDAFEGAELSPKTDLWDKIETQLAPPTPDAKVGKYGYLFSLGLLLFLGGFFVQKTTPAKVQTSLWTSADKSLPAQMSREVSLASPQVQQNALPTRLSRTAPAMPDALRTLPTSTQQHLNLPTRESRISKADKMDSSAMPDAPRTLPTHESRISKADKMDSSAVGFKPMKGKGSMLQRATQELRRKMQEILKQNQPTLQESAVEALTPLAIRFPKLAEPKAQQIHTVIYSEAVPPVVYLKNFWIGVQRGVTLNPTKLDIHYDKYLEDYAKVHQLTDGVNLTDFFTEVDEKSHYSIANQGDIRFGYHFSPRWQFMTGIQYRMEFLEQTTNAFFVNYYDYSRHSFLLDILEGNIQSPAFSQALQNHPTYSPITSNNFTISQFNQQSSIHLSSQFEYIGIPMQIGYTIRPFKKLGFTILGGAQVDKLTRSTTSSYELKDDVATTYRLNTASKISTWSWQIGGGIQAEYHFNTRWALTTNSILFQNIKSIKENKYVEVRPRGLQINMGAKYMF